MNSALSRVMRTGGHSHIPFLEPLSTEIHEPQWERESAVMGVYEAAPRPRWTTERPTHPGVWWVRESGFDAKVVAVHKRDGELFFGWTDIPITAIPRTGLEWSDRAITEPVESHS